MSQLQGCTNRTDVVESLKDALEQRIGSERFRLWFGTAVEFSIQTDEPSESSFADGDLDDSITRFDGASILLRVRGQFALERIRKTMLPEIRGAALQACGPGTKVAVRLDQPEPTQSDLPLGVEATPEPRADGERSQRTSHESKQPARRRRRRSGPAPQQLTLPTLQTFANESADDPGDQESAPGVSAPVPAPARMSLETFVAGSCNQLGTTAMKMVCDDPKTASPLFVCGPTGSGKTHMLTAIAEQLRRRHRMRRVMMLSAEQFTNDFVSSVGSSGITGFRRRYRDVDALLVDGIDFLGSKQATIREMLYTVETLSSAGRPLVFSGLHAPTDTPGLSRELAGRLAAGLVCPIQPFDEVTRETILRRWVDQRCALSVSDQLIEQLNPALAGDGRVISGVVNLINTLQRMTGAAPTMDQLRRYGGELLRAAQPAATIALIESAVCQTFHLPEHTLRCGSQTRSVTQPRMLAMYLSRRLTSSAYTEIARHFGGKSHSTAIMAEKNVKNWLGQGKSIGRGAHAISVQEAIDRVENLLRCS